jgi:hypothetical protein
MPFPGTNPLINGIDAILKILIYDVGVAATIAALKAQFPFLNLPIISAVFDKIVTAVANSLYTQLDKFVVIKVIDFQTQAQKDAYDSAVKELTAAHNSGDEDATNKAKEDFKKKLHDLIKFNGS